MYVETERQKHGEKDLDRQTERNINRDTNGKKERLRDWQTK